jgi:hypothetical protein
MEDLTTENKTPDAVAISPTAAKQTGWLTKNRFWNLVFLFAIPVGIHLSVLMWSWLMLIATISTIIVIFNFVPTDEGTITPTQARGDAFAKAACGIFFASIIALFFVSSTILPIVAMFFGQFALGGAVFLIFLVPISILCYANIPLSSCVEAKDASEITISSWSYRRLSLSQSWRPENVFHKR